MIRTLGIFAAATVMFAACFAAGCGPDQPVGTAGAGGEAWGSGGTGGAGTAGKGGMGGSMGGMIPDPGMAMNAEWTDVEPNDDPSQAVPVPIRPMIIPGSTASAKKSPVTLL